MAPYFYNAPYYPRPSAYAMATPNGQPHMASGTNGRSQPNSMTPANSTIDTGHGWTTPQGYPLSSHLVHYSPQQQQSASPHTQQHIYPHLQQPFNPHSQHLFQPQVQISFQPQLPIQPLMREPVQPQLQQHVQYPPQQPVQSPSKQSVQYPPQEPVQCPSPQQSTQEPLQRAVQHPVSTPTQLQSLPTNPPVSPNSNLREAVDLTHESIDFQETAPEVAQQGQPVSRRHSSEVTLMREEARTV
ncbi:hypothetical protein BCR34DRAFT_666192, partial [Clohesyomyces aquaticus]